MVVFALVLFPVVVFIASTWWLGTRDTVRTQAEIQRSRDALRQARSRSGGAARGTQSSRSGGWSTTAGPGRPNQGRRPPSPPPVRSSRGGPSRRGPVRPVPGAPSGFPSKTPPLPPAPPVRSNPASEGDAGFPLPSNNGPTGFPRSWKARPDA